MALVCVANYKDGNRDKVNAIMTAGSVFLSSFIVLTGIISIVYIIPLGKKNSKLFIKEEDYITLMKDNEIDKSDLDDKE